jgi:hypothetical protein
MIERNLSKRDLNELSKDYNPRDYEYNGPERRKSINSYVSPELERRKTKLKRQINQ